MKKQPTQSGFTLIELVVVIVILGILAATALPKFVDLKSDAGNAAAAGVGAALTSAAAINYAAKQAGSQGVTAKSCAEFAALLQGGALPGAYAITEGAASFAAGAIQTGCKVGDTSGSAYFTAIGA